MQNHSEIGRPPQKSDEKSFAPPPPPQTNENEQPYWKNLCIEFRILGKWLQKNPLLKSRRHPSI